MSGKVGTGRPDGKDRALSDDDRRKVDYDLNPVVEGMPWGDVGTNLYLSIYGSPRDFHATATGWQGRALMAGGLYFVVGSSTGKPKMSQDGWGLSLEIPADLARDEAKKDYVMQWVLETTKEILGQALASGAFTGLSDHQGFAMWLHTAAEDVIGRTGL